MPTSTSGGTVSPARRAAYNTLKGHKKRPFGVEYDADLKPHRPHGSGLTRERIQSHALVQGVLRHLSLIDYLIDRGGYFDRKRTPDNHIWILRLAVFEKVFQSSAPDYALGEQAVELARESGGGRSASFVNALVRRLFPELPADISKLEEDPDIRNLEPRVRWSIPDPILEFFQAAYGCEDFESVVRSYSVRQPGTWLRVNTLKTTPPKLQRELQSEGLDVKMNLKGLPALLWVGGSLKPWQTRAWQAGQMTIQDPGSMLAGIILDPQPGDSVLDLCAAPGGKTGHLWERMLGKGNLVALEVNSGRRDGILKENLGRLYGQGHPIRMPAIDSLDQFDPGMAFGRVLIDSPCLGLGLISRHPESRWDNRVRKMDMMCQQQTWILDQGSRHVGESGRLLWVTCSPTLDENEGVIHAWLGRNPGFRIVKNILVAEELMHSACDLDDGFLRTRPDRFPGDGFCMVLLERS